MSARPGLDHPVGVLFLLIPRACSARKNQAQRRCYGPAGDTSTTRPHPSFPGKALLPQTRLQGPVGLTYGTRSRSAAHPSAQRGHHDLGSRRRACAEQEKQQIFVGLRGELFTKRPLRPPS
ncbi:hypothetical protein NDU88_006758 [Pleurodeles waltl]|uniref:Secreted protein n=1 Tax=Pleurodeles waltl TaxID=8319 RepID=A0AAV7TXY8_PLEWA|nr:hypothetical protein NDU88_006758 [Pleurodeles waltl]